MRCYPGTAPAPLRRPQAPSRMPTLISMPGPGVQNSSEGLVAGLGQRGRDRPLFILPSAQCRGLGCLGRRGARVVTLGPPAGRGVAGPWVALVADGLQRCWGTCCQAHTPAPPLPSADTPTVHLHTPCSSLSPAQPSGGFQGAVGQLGKAPRRSCALGLASSHHLSGLGCSACPFRWEKPASPPVAEGVCTGDALWRPPVLVPVYSPSCPGGSKPVFPGALPITPTTVTPESHCFSSL